MPDRKVSSQPRVSVIVPMYNAEPFLPVTMDSLARLEHDSHEVIFVDDGSTDRSAELVRERGFTLVRLDRNHGAGAARNVGAHVASGEILAFTDADCIVPPRWLQGIEQSLKRDDIFAVSGPYGDSHGKQFAPLFALYLLEVKERGEEALVRSCTTSNLACRRDTFWEFGGFPLFGLGRNPDRPFHGHEDSNFAYFGSAALGKDLLWKPTLTVGHQFREGIIDFLRQQLFFGKVMMVSYCRCPVKLLSKRSNFNKVSTLAQIIAILLVVPGVALAATLSLAQHPPLLAAAIAAIPVAFLVAVVLMNIRFLRHLIAKKPGATFLAKSIALLPLTYVAWILGGFTGLGLSLRAGFQFTDIEGLPPHEIG